MFNSIDSQDRVVSGDSLDFRSKANLGLVFAALLILTPFGINNFLQGRLLLGAASMIIVFAMGITGWLIYHRRDPGWISMLVVVPAVIGFLSMSIQNQGFIGVMWCYPGILSFFVIFRERQAPIAALLLIAVLVPQIWVTMGGGIGLRAAATLIAVGTFTSIFLFTIMDAQSKLRKLAITDPLTGLRNRVMLSDALNRAMQVFLRTDTPMTLLAIDVDHFKSVNDELGHAMGDQVLESLGEILTQRFRQVDQIFRLGGEEFLVVLNGTGGAEGTIIAEDLRKRIDERRLLSSRALTVSIGVASLESDDTVEGWMQRADANLYRAKSQGRNQVVAG